MENTATIRKLALTVANANAFVEKLQMELSDDDSLISSKDNSIIAIYLWTGQYSKAIKISQFNKNILPY